MGAPGHLFVVKADMLKIDCDAVLIPVGPEFEFDSAWRPFLGVSSWRDLQPRTKWAAGETVRRLDLRPDDPVSIYATCVAVPYESHASMSEAIGIAAAAAVEFVRTAARDVRPAPHRADQPPRLALPMVGTGKGGLRTVTGDVVEPLVDGLTSAAAECGVDVVLCTIHEGDWSAVQWVRSIGPTEDTWNLPDHLLKCSADIAGHAKDGNLVLFMGAGVGRDAGLPDWDFLLRELAEAARVNDSDLKRMESLDPRDRARLIERRATDELGQSEMRQRIAERLSSDRFGLSHALLSSLGVQSAVTTNYDSLYEQSALLPGSKREMPRRLPYEPITQSTSWLLKLHGDIEKGDVVITRSDYLGLARHRSALFGVVQALLLTRHLLFVGYSMNDDDFHALVDEIESALGSEVVRELGTALVLERTISSELWDDLIDIEEMKPGDGSSAARTLLKVLDRAACLAADHSAHLLDEDYSGLFTDDELYVASRLKEVLKVADGLPSGSIARTALEKLRSELGGSRSGRSG